MSKKIKKIVLAYSGGLDTSVILKWLIETYNCDVVAVTADLGQEEDLVSIEKKALETGACKARIEDLRAEFAKDFIFPMLRSGALYEGRYLLGTAISRPLITKALVKIAREENADAIAHGSTGKGNDQARFEITAAALDPNLQIIAPWREWNLLSRKALNEFAQKHNIPIPSSNKRYSIDKNMLHCSFEGNELEDPWEEPGQSSYSMSTPVEKAPDEPEYVELEFKKGNPVALNNTPLPPEKLILALNALAGRHGVGRVDMVENRYVGIKSRGVYETPGGTVIYIARQDLEGIALEHATLHIRNQLASSYADAVYNGFWFSPEREAMQAFMDKTQESVSGTVRLKLYKGNAWPVGRTSPNSLYKQEIATFEEDSGYNHKDASGFIRLNCLRIRGYKHSLI